MGTDPAAQRRLERSLALVRLAAVPFVASQVLIGWVANSLSVWPWLITAGMALGAVGIYALSGAELEPRGQRALAIGALTFDTAVFAAFALASSYELSAPTRLGLILPVAEAAVRFAVVGALVVTAATAPVLVASEYLRITYTASGSYRWDVIVFQVALEAALGALVGWLVGQLDRERRLAESRAQEAEKLRDQLGRRADLVDAANRCARALSSSLDLDRAFAAFIRELSALLDFDRVAIVMADGGDALTLATAGRSEEAVFPAGTRVPMAGTLLADIIAGGQAVERQDMRPGDYPEEEEFVRVGLHARVAAPVFAGPRAVGMLAVSRAQPNSFTRVDVELLTLLGRLVGSAVQNIRSHEAERRTVEELRRLSMLRADFVSLVSHELRSPMAAVIGAARTLQGRWRELNADQRESFLALIGDETARLADLISDVLDTSRIEAGTFTFSFGDVDVGELVREVVGTASVGQDEVKVTADVLGSLPRLRGDRKRLRQVLQNVVDNAVKYSSAGGEVRILARASDGAVRVDITDEGPGIPYEDQRLIFERFGRSSASGAKPGSGLGLFIARSIVEAHGGTLGVESIPACGATFVIKLPVDL